MGIVRLWEGGPSSRLLDGHVKGYLEAEGRCSLVGRLLASLRDIFRRWGDSPSFRLPDGLVKGVSSSAEKVVPC